MKDLNRVTLLGRLGTDPVVRRTKKGTPVTTLTIATSRWMPDSSPIPEGAPDTRMPKQTTEWHRIVAWGKEAESCERFLKKGSLVYVEGELRTRKYVDSQNITRYSTEITAGLINFVNNLKLDDPRPSPSEDSDDEEFMELDDVA